MGDILKGLKSGKTMLFLSIALIAGIALLAFSFFTKKSGNTGSKSDVSAALTDEYVESLETEAASLISRISGVSDVHVLISVESGSELDYSNGELVKMTSPKIRGAAVVCNGGDSPVICEKIIGLLGALYGIPSNHIYVSG